MQTAQKRRHILVPRGSGNNVRPSGRLPSRLVRPTSFLVTGMPVEVGKSPGNNIVDSLMPGGFTSGLLTN